MKLLRHPASCKLAAIVAASLVIGCLGSSPNIDLYTMSAASDPVASAGADSLAIGVGPIRVPRYLDRPDWVTRRMPPVAARLQLQSGQAFPSRP